MPAKCAEYRLTPEAERDMEAIWLYTFEEWGLEQANRYTDELTEAFAQLAANPKMAAPCDRIRKGYRHSQVGRHVIYFRQTDYGIVVVRVLHGRMLPTLHL
ncbi:MAG: type II toxin-antitoxin system RelE/ParE family toxin [Burkholderiales bacterium]|nr:type II toxin-antitoxin system RelE/ParE family toxin [Nitrosomonas sp.]MCP5273834.1 type II toxin-antitoxin system RelE/ParE family toxin [Burkholderiales bacterium]